MAIRMMTSKEVYETALAAGATNVEKVSNYPGHVEGSVLHGRPRWEGDTERVCPHYDDAAFAAAKGPGCGMGCYSYGALYMETTHVGLVLSVGERNGYDDSDFYAVVWNPAKGHTETVTYATTRGWTYPNSASPDATPEVRAAFDAYVKAARKADAERKAAEDAAKPAKGKTLKVVKGRKVPVGTVGSCIWVGANKWGVRVGIKDPSGNVHWTAATNVVVV